MKKFANRTIDLAIKDLYYRKKKHLKIIKNRYDSLNDNVSILKGIFDHE